MNSSDLKINVPDSVYQLVKDVISNGVFYLILPSPELLTKWVSEDTEIFENDEQKKDYLEKVKKDAQEFSNFEVVESDEEKNDENDEKENNILKPYGETMRIFFDNVAEAVSRMMIMDFLPNFTELNEEQVLVVTKKAKELTKEIDSAIYDLLLSIKNDLDSPMGKQILEAIKSDSADRPVKSKVAKGDEVLTMDDDSICMKLMKKHNFENISISWAKERLLPHVFENIDKSMEEFCGYFNVAVLKKVEELFLEERSKIPEPEFLE